VADLPNCTELVVVVVVVLLVETIATPTVQLAVSMTVSMSL
jgi:hypothetical protein